MAAASTSWELVWEVHNLPVRPGRAHIDVLEHARLSGNGSLGYIYLGRSESPSECATLVASRSGAAASTFFSYVWLMPGFGRSELRRACFGVTSQRWRPAYHTKANSAHTTYGRNSRTTLERCLRLLFSHYQHVGDSDVLLFHNGDFAAPDQTALRKGRPRLFFELLADEYWRTPSYYFEHEKEFRATKFALGYRHMIRWWTRVVFHRAGSLGYEWVMRMDDDSLLLSDVRYNLFQFMASRGLQYGYRLVSCELVGVSYAHWHCRGRMHAARSDHPLVWVYSGTRRPIKHGNYYRMLQRYVLMRGVPANALGSHCARPEPEHFGMPACGRAVWGVYNNFFIANVSFWMEPAVQAFLDYVDHTGVVYLFNWNDILWHTAIIKLFLPKAAIHHFRDFTYQHATMAGPHFKRVAWGLMQAGTDDPNGTAAVSKWAKQYRLATVMRDGVAHAGYNNCPNEYN